MKIYIWREEEKNKKMYGGVQFLAINATITCPNSTEIIPNVIEYVTHLDSALAHFVYLTKYSDSHYESRSKYNVFHLIRIEKYTSITQFNT